MPTRGFTDASGRVSVYDPDLTALHTTSSIWRTCPLQEYKFDQYIGHLCDEQWNSYNAAATTGDYIGTAATAGSAVISTTVQGALLIDSGSTTQHQGFNLQRAKSMFIPAANKSIWAEYKVSLTATTPPVTKAEIFVGLAALDTTFYSSGSHSTNNRIGWHIQTAELLALTFGADKAGTATTKTGTTLVDATAVRLGFFYDGVADTVQQYIDGVSTGTAITTTHIPKLAIYPTIVCQTDGTDQPKLTVYPYRIFQLT